MSGETLSLLVASGTVIAAIITATATRRSSASGSWRDLVGALETRLEKLEGEVAGLTAKLERTKDDLDNAREIIEEQEHQIEQQAGRIAVLEDRLRELGEDPNGIPHG